MKDKKILGGTSVNEIKDTHAISLARSLLQTHKAVKGFGFNSHFISLVPGNDYLYLSYIYKNGTNTTHRLFQFLKRKGGYTQEEVEKVLMAIRKEYGHKHDRQEYNDDYQEVVDYLINKHLMDIQVLV